jgi:hypothetical protein
MLYLFCRSPCENLEMNISFIYFAVPPPVHIIVSCQSRGKITFLCDKKHRLFSHLSHSVGILLFPAPFFSFESMNANSAYVYFHSIALLFGLSSLHSRSSKVNNRTRDTGQESHKTLCEKVCHLSGI